MQGWPCEAADGDRARPGRGNTVAPGYRRRPRRSGLTHAERGNPARARRHVAGGLVCEDWPIVRAGTGWPKKPRPAAERQRETAPRCPFFQRMARITGWIRGDPAREGC